MSEPNWEARARWLAEKVMGWHQRDGEWVNDKGDLDPDYYPHMAWVELWRPDWNKRQAIEVVEALLAMTMETDGEKWSWVVEMGGASTAIGPEGSTRVAPYYWCDIEDSPLRVSANGVLEHSYSSGSQEGLTEAIVLAACEATGYEGE